jgi:hypothetical protein
MHTGISISVTATDSSRVEAIVAARGSPQKHVWRARIILLSDQGLGTNAIMAATAKSKTVQDLRVALAGALHGRASVTTHPFWRSCGDGAEDGVEGLVSSEA